MLNLLKKMTLEYVHLDSSQNEVSALTLQPENLLHLHMDGYFFWKLTDSEI